MRMLTPVLILTVMLFGSSLQGDDTKLNLRLLGTWKSNRDLTSETIRPTLKIPEEKLNDFLSLFGRMRIVYTKDTMTATMPANKSFPAWKHSTSYRVIGSTNDTIKIQAHDWPIGENKPTTIHFVSPDRYWVQIDPPYPTKVDMTAWREYFDRVSEE
jgi:hypothetical protein